jgi:hypothetical protein
MANTLLRAVRSVSSALSMGIIFMMLSFCGGAHAADGTGLAGKWKMTSITPDGSKVNWVLTTKQENGAWTATVGGNDATAEAKEVKVNGASLHMKTPYGGDYYDVDVKLYGDKLTGKWSGNSDGGATTGTRITVSAAK